MVWYIIIGVVLLLVIVFRFKWASGKHLLATSIVTNDGFEFEVTFKKLFPKVKSIEFLRLILNFISKIYFITSESRDEVRINIKHLLRTISESNNLESGLSEIAEQITLTKDLAQINSTRKLSAT